MTLSNTNTYQFHLIKEISKYFLQIIINKYNGIKNNNFLSI